MNRTNKVIRLGRANPIKSRLRLSEVEAAKLRLGMKTIATVQVYPTTRFEGRLTAISTASRTITVEASIRKPERLALPGMFATGQIEQPAAEDAVYAQRAELILLVQVQAGDLADRRKTSVAVGRVEQRSQRGRPRISGKRKQDLRP